MTLPSPARLLCAAVLSLGLAGSAIPALALDAAPSVPAAPTIPPTPAPADPTIPPTSPSVEERATGEPVAPTATLTPSAPLLSPQLPGTPSTGSEGIDASTSASPDTVPYDQLIASPAKQSELAGPLGASLGQGLERIVENDDPQVPTDEENELLALIVEGKSIDEATDRISAEDEGGTNSASAARESPGQVSPAPFAAATNYWKPSGVLGVDVSSHQGTVDWAGAWSYGSRFAYVKATEGTYYKNEFFGGQYGGADNQGMLRGAYHFATPNTTSGSEQARFFVANGGGWSADGKTLPPLLDIEYNPYTSLGNVCYNMSPTQMVNWIRDFSNTMRTLTGRLPMIYSTADWWNTCTGRSTAFSDHPLHIASYSNYGPGTLAAGWNSYALWQYTSEGPVVGDWNQWPGDLNGLRTFATGSERAPAVVVPVDKSLKVFSPGDFNGDGRADMVTRRTDGT
ncbi:lysozyme, partial [Arthrobacter cheniae]|uniref:lysozyme n=1 Tax=Arthrobacter cheniae TaxID=1258888 RepID=UPI001F2EB010